MSIAYYNRAERGLENPAEYPENEKDEMSKTLKKNCSKITYREGFDVKDKITEIGIREVDLKN